MTYVEWSSDLETGIPLVDKDHKVLVSLLNQVHEALEDREERATLGSVLNSLAEYTVYHFAREERLQEVAGYGDLDAHRRRHAELSAQVESIRATYLESPESVRGEEVLAFLRSWLIDHILKHDMDYVAVCASDAAAQEAAERMRFCEDDVEDTAAEPVPVNWSALKVLVVEDNRNFQLIIKTILRSLGVRNIVVVDGGAEGLAHLASEPVDLVLCDWRMEEMDGLQFVRTARDRRIESHIIMMSGYGTDAVRDEALAVGVDDFLEKPITARGFLETASRVMARPAA